jgi:hypothetical protein
VIINEVMGYKKLNIALSGLCLAIWLPTAIVFLLMNTIVGYVVSAVFFGFSCYVGYYFYRILWLYNWGRPLSEEKNEKESGTENRCTIINVITYIADYTVSRMRRK